MLDNSNNILHIGITGPVAFCGLIFLPRFLFFRATQIAKFMGPTWDPPGSCQPQMGPMLAPWTLLSWDVFHPKISRSLEVARICITMVSCHASANLLQNSAPVLRVSDSQLSCCDLTRNQGTRVVGPIKTTRVTFPINRQFGNTVHSSRLPKLYITKSRHFDTFEKGGETC